MNTTRLFQARQPDRRPMTLPKARSWRQSACKALQSPFQRLARPLFLAPVAAFNEAAAEIAKAIGAINEQLSADDWIRVTPFGSFPNRAGQQVCDREAGEKMIAAFNSLATKLATLFRGLPIYEGHPDVPEWRKANPGARAIAVGRLKELQLREDGLWSRVAWNDSGTALVRGDAPAYTAQSPYWLMLPLPRPKTFRPVELLSLGLTNLPNIPDTLLGVNEASDSSPIMKEILIKLLAAMGKAPAADATDEQITTAANEVITAAPAIVTATNELPGTKAKLVTAEAATATAQTAATTAANEAATAKTQLAAERTARGELLLVAAVNEGRITAAQKPEWAAKFSANGADFTAITGELGKLKKAVNTRSQLGALVARKQETGASQEKIAAINTALVAKKKENPKLSHTEAFNEVRLEKPELFATE